MFKKIKINIPFSEALTQMPHYAKFMKDVLRKKKKIVEEGVVNLTATCSAVIQIFTSENAGSKQLHYSLHHREF